MSLYGKPQFISPQLILGATLWSHKAFLRIRSATSFTTVPQIVCRAFYMKLVTMNRSTNICEQLTFLKNKRILGSWQLRQHSCFLNNSFISYNSHTILYDSMVLSISTELCNHDHNQFRTLSYPKMKPCTHQQSPFISPHTPQSQATTNILSVSRDQSICINGIRLFEFGLLNLA